MLVQLASDLHIDLIESRFPGARLIEPAPGADVLVLAGDIHRSTEAVAAFADWPTPIIYVIGNHESFSADWEKSRAALRAACAGTNIHLLDNGKLEFSGVRFIGSTLWTDFSGQRGTDQAFAMKEAARLMGDYQHIQTGDGRLQPHHTLAEHVLSRAYLESELAKPFKGKTVVCTHHGPHALSVHRRFAGSPINAAFVSDLTPLLFKASAWLHGHVHSSHDYAVGGCRVVTNPAGYVRNSLDAESPTDLVFENPDFDPTLVIDTNLLAQR